MPASTVAVFNDPQAFESALQLGCSVELLVTGHGRFQSEFIGIALPRLRLLRGKERLPRIAVLSVAPGSVLVVLPTQPEQQQACAGANLAAGEILTATAGERLHMWTRGPCNWGAISVSAKEFIRYGQAVVGREFRLASGVVCLRPSQTSFQALMTLFRAAMRLTEARPTTPLKTDEAIRGLEQEAIRVMLECVSTATVRANLAADRCRATMGRLDQALQDCDGRILRVSDICTALGISHRILQACCRQHVGISASRYFRLRGMRRIYNALMQANSETASVSEIAKSHGFNGSGRFAAVYRRQFGESPSATLRRNAT